MILCIVVFQKILSIKKNQFKLFFIFLYLSVEQNDPALNNAEIEGVLAENKREANIKTEKVY